MSHCPLAVLILTSLILSSSNVYATGSKKEAKSDRKEALNNLNQNDTKKEEEDKRRWSVNANYGLRIGQGTFVDPPVGVIPNDPRGDGSNAFDRVQNLYAFGGGYELNDDFSLSLGIAWTHWLTAGGGFNEAGETRFQDIDFGASWSGVEIKPIGARFRASASLSLPSSDLSRAAGTIVNTGVSMAISKRFFKKLSLSASLSGGKTFHEAISPVGDLSRAGSGNLLFRAGGAENLGGGLIAIGGLNTEYSLGTGLNASVSIIKNLRFSARYTLLTFWTYAPAESNDDELRSPFGDAGRGTSQIVSTGAGFSYSFLEHFNASLGIRTIIPPKTADNRSFNFPFWNFQGAAANRSQISIGLGASY